MDRIINNSLSSDHKADVNIHDDLNVIQYLVVMLGNVHIAIVIQGFMNYSSSKTFRKIVANFSEFTKHVKSRLNGILCLL